MKIRVKNLGILKSAEFDVGDLTIICGGNNTGKTYAVYALYGFLKLWRNIISIKPLQEHCHKVIDSGVVRIDLKDYQRHMEHFLEDACKKYTEILPKVFASSEKLFVDSDFKIELEMKRSNTTKKYKKVWRSKKKDLIVFSKEEGSTILEITSLQEKGEEPLPLPAMERFTNEVMLEILFAPLLPETFIASAERTGAAIFRKELDFARNRLLEQIGSEKAFDPFKLLNRVYGDYAMPVKDNVEFTLDLENAFKMESFITKDHPEILGDFKDIIGGEYKVMRNELLYIPRHGRVRLSMDESSSAVRSLLDIGFYLRHVAKPGDLLVVDEPELNLHPENQRRMARLFVRLTNVGVRVFLTTHSDYIIKELNTLIMLNNGQGPLTKLMEKYGYIKEELLSTEQIRVFNSGKHSVKLPDQKRKSSFFTFIPSPIDSHTGIEVKGFDTSIIEMNAIQEEILFAEEHE